MKSIFYDTFSSQPVLQVHNLYDILIEYIIIIIIIFMPRARWSPVRFYFLRNLIEHAVTIIIDSPLVFLSYLTHVFPVGNFIKQQLNLCNLSCWLQHVTIEYRILQQMSTTLRKKLSMKYIALTSWYNVQISVLYI